MAAAALRSRGVEGTDVADAAAHVQPKRRSNTRVLQTTNGIKDHMVWIVIVVGTVPSSVWLAPSNVRCQALALGGR